MLPQNRVESERLRYLFTTYAKVVIAGRRATKQTLQDTSSLIILHDDDERHIGAHSSPHKCKPYGGGEKKARTYSRKGRGWIKL